MKSASKLCSLLFLLLAGCSTQSSNQALFSDVAIDDSVMGKWGRSCALCHVEGVANAPVVGDSAEWQRRLAQGEETVMRNVIEGINSMPPLGYCMSCEREDFRAMVAFMAGTNR